MSVLITDEESGYGPDVEPLRRLAERALEMEGVSRDSELSVALVGTARMAELNSHYLGREGATDVLSFSQQEEGLAGGENLLGDVIVCPREVLARRDIYQVAAGDEVALVVVHGILHLLGYDDASEEGNRAMDERARRILEGMKRDE
ncbi:MAG: rRNA maturation RNase YbeY [Candidatus Geothermincolia bacterium]